MPLTPPAKPAVRWTQTLCGAAVVCAAATTQVLAQTQIVRPPKVQLWMASTTASGSAAKAPTRSLDLALWNSQKPGTDAALHVPAVLKMSDSLALTALTQDPSPRDVSAVLGHELVPPKGRLLQYWGCGDAVRAGQPRVLDFSNISGGTTQIFATALTGRMVAERSLRVKTGFAVYPNEREAKPLAGDSSLVGEHRLIGDGLPGGLRFSVAAAQDAMPAITVQTQGHLQDSLQLSWPSVVGAQAYYLHAIATVGDDTVVWTSSETGDAGTGLLDYLPNASIDIWTRERALLGAAATQCAIPKGILTSAGGKSDATLRMVAYGGEHSWAQPARPADSRVAWEPDWAVRLRLKSETRVALDAVPGNPNARPDAPVPADKASAPKPKHSIMNINPFNLLRGLFGR